MHFRAHFSERWKRLADITQQAIEQYKVDRSHVKLTTLYKELVTLSRFLKWCRRAGYLGEVPEFERVRPVTDYRPVDLSPAEARALLAQLPDRTAHPKRYPVREFFTVQWAQGLRPGELRTLTWQDVDLRKRRLTIIQSNDKARTGRTIGLAPESYRVLKEMAKHGTLASALVFGRSEFRTSLKLAAERCKLGKVTPHHLRHARLSELASSTRDVAAVQYFAGHKNLATTDKYVRSRTERTELMLKELGKAARRAPKARRGAQQKSARAR